MTRPASSTSLASDYDAFLFAPIGEERNGMPLSVLSALARIGVDPWQEAAQLARLPGKSAIQQLLLRIEALPNPPMALGDLGILATRLVALLPKREAVQEPKRVVGNGWIAFYFAFAALLVGTEIILASQPAPISGSDTSSKPASDDR